MKTKILIIAFSTFIIASINTYSQTHISIGTQITMGDDSRRSVDKLEIGDMVLSYDQNKGIYEKKKIVNIDKAMYNRMVRLVLENKLQILTSNDQPFLGEQGWVSIDPEKTTKNPKHSNTKIKEASIGNYLYYYDVLSTASDRIAFFEGITEPIMAYSITLEGGGSIIANGFIVGTN